MLISWSTCQGKELPDPGVQEAGVVDDGDLRVDHLCPSDVDHSVCVGAGYVFLLYLFVWLSFTEESWTFFRGRTSWISVNCLKSFSKIHFVKIVRIMLMCCVCLTWEISTSSNSFWYSLRFALNKSFSCLRFLTSVLAVESLNLKYLLSPHHF